MGISFRVRDRILSHLSVIIGDHEHALEPMLEYSLKITQEDMRTHISKNIKFQ